MSDLLQFGKAYNYAHEISDDSLKDLHIHASLLEIPIGVSWAYGKEKIRGGKEICPTFSDCARVVKKNFPEKLSKIR